MDLFSITLGIVIGAAFSPFWMKVWEVIKVKLASFAKTQDTK